MYRLDWVEQLKLRTATLPSRKHAVDVSPTVWKLGITSLLTDVSAEMVNSVLPVYLFLHLHLNPLQYGAIDGIYNGFAIALLSLVGGIAADRTGRHKEVATAGYTVSALCKLLLLVGTGIWTWTAAIVAIDRTGKGVRSAPRDALISFNSSQETRALAFAVHRSLDAAGSLLGPLVAFLILSQVPGAFDGVWMVSFVFALLGVAMLHLFVQNPLPATMSNPQPAFLEITAQLLKRDRFRRLAFAGTALSAATISDGFFYLLLNRQGGPAAGFFPLLYVVTASWYMLLSVPVGIAADRFRRTPVLLGGYGILACIYVVLLTGGTLSFAGWFTILFFFGLYYAATEGVLMAMASTVIPVQLRSTGLAILASFIALGKLVSSLLFGLLWHAHGSTTSVLVFALALFVAVLTSGVWLGTRFDEVPQ